METHKGAFEYDWRTRFHTPLREVGESMTWGEAWRLTQQLGSDPSSHVTAAIAGWDHPIGRADMTLRDLYDLQHLAKAKKKPKPYPRPWPDADKERRKFGTARYTPAQLRAVLDAHRGADN